MYLNLNILLIILSCEYFAIWTRGTNVDDYEAIFKTTIVPPQENQTERAVLLEPVYGRYYNEEDCNIAMPEKDDNMPIVFTHESKPPTIVYPDRNGFLKIKGGSSFKMLCSGNSFEKPLKNGQTEIKVKCLNKTLIEFRNKAYDFKEFKCLKMPKSKLVITTRQCQNNESVGMKVGFQTRSSFLTLYGICFDMNHKNVLYTWYQIQTPKCYRYQTTNWSGVLNKEFYKTRVYEKINVTRAYIDQKTTMLRIIRSRKMSAFYIVKKPGEVRFLVPGFLTTPLEFPYNFQHQATTYYENTAPQWYKFHMITWRKIQEAIDLVLRRQLNKSFLVVSGVYGVGSLLNADAKLKELFLALPESLAVPKFFWKLIYNYDTRKGTVYIGLNTAFHTLTIEKRMCAGSMCPGFPSRDDFERAVVYCCSKESFERKYGRLDPYLFTKY